MLALKRPYWLIVYGGGDSKDNGSSDIGGRDSQKDRAEPVLVLFFYLYSKLDLILISTSKLSSYCSLLILPDIIY